MNELIKEIEMHEDRNDRRVCENLKKLIFQRKLNTPEELKKYEDDHVTLASGIRLTDEQIAERYYSIYNENEYLEQMDEEYLFSDPLPDEDIRQINELERRYVDTEDTESRLIILIRLYTLSDFDPILPYHTYRYILEERI